MAAWRSALAVLELATELAADRAVLGTSPEAATGANGRCLAPNHAAVPSSLAWCDRRRCGVRQRMPSVSGSVEATEPATTPRASPDQDAELRRPPLCWLAAAAAAAVRATDRGVNRPVAPVPELSASRGTRASCWAWCGAVRVNVEPTVCKERAVSCVVDATDASSSPLRAPTAVVVVRISGTSRRNKALASMQSTSAMGATPLKGKARPRTSFGPPAGGRVLPSVPSGTCRENVR